MSQQRARLGATLLLCGLALAACTPGLNWREVRLGRLTALLPCKPDTATRTVELGGQSLPLEVAGCEVGGTLFALSRLQARDAAQAPALMAAWRQASLQTVRARAVQAMPGSGDAQTSFDLRLDGQHANGAAVQVRYKWLVQDAEVYQLAVYAAQLRAEQTEPLLGEARIR